MHFLEQKCMNFAKDFLNKNVWISLKISLKFITIVQINNIPVLVPIMAWRWPGHKQLSETMMIILLMHICVTRLQWVNGAMPSSDTTQNNIFFLFSIDSILSLWTGCHTVWAVHFFSNKRYIEWKHAKKTKVKLLTSSFFRFSLSVPSLKLLPRLRVRLRCLGLSSLVGTSGEVVPQLAEGVRRISRVLKDRAFFSMRALGLGLVGSAENKNTDQPLSNL